MDSSSSERRILKVIEKRQTTHNTFCIKLESEEDLPHTRPIYHVWIYDQAGNKKPYSPLHATKRHITLEVKRYESGTVSKYITDRSVGDLVTVSDFLLMKRIMLNEYKNVLMIAGGTGLTPMYQILKEHIYSGINTTDYTLLFLNKTDEDVFLLSELESLKKKSNGKLQIFYILDEMTENPDSERIGGKLNKDMLLTVTRSKIFEQVYICGPGSLLESFSGKKISPTEQGELTGILKEIGYTEKNVYKF